MKAPALYFCSISVLLSLWGSVIGLAGKFCSTEPSKWNLAQAQKLLNDSPWAAQQTITEVIGGVGSGLYGEKELYHRFFVRFMSAPPIRDAYLRIEEILDEAQAGASGPKEGQTDLTKELNCDSDQWIVVGVSFRSNDTEMEQSVWNTLQNQTLGTLQSRVYLSTDRFPRIEPLAYFPPREPAIGARFAFPRRLSGTAVISENDPSVSFFLDLPSDIPSLRISFPLKPMIIDGEVVL